MRSNVQVTDARPRSERKRSSLRPLMAAFPAMRIRSRLLLLAIAVLVPSFIGAGIGIGHVYNEERKFNRNSLRSTARALALVVDREIAQRETALRVLSASPALDRGDFRTFYQHAQRLASERNVAILLSDRDGAQIVNTRLPFGAPLPRMLPLTKRLRDQYGPYATIVTNLYMPPPAAGNEHSFGIQIPVIRDGKVLYYLGMGTYVSQLQRVFAEQRLPSQWLGGIIDREGIVVARSKDAEKFVGQPVSDAFARKLNVNEGFHEGVTLDGMPATAFFSRAPSSGWVFSVAVPSHLLQQAAVEASALMAVISLLLLALAVGAAFTVARVTVPPVEALRIAAARLGRGKRVAPSRSGIVEIDAVNQAMVQAGENIRAAKAELEQRVTAAVASAEQSQRALLQAQKLEALGRLTGGIAHDFNNVLQSLSAGLELAALRSTDGQVERSLASCMRGVRRAAELTAQLAVFGRMQEARPETIDTAKRLREMLPLLKGGLRGDIELRLDIASDLWPLTLDALQFELALLNLCINARDAMPRGGILRIEARNETLTRARDELAAGDYVRLTVADNGEGMRPEVLARALDPFFTTKSVGKGSGMGLPQAYGFARQAGGTLILSSPPGQGTEVMLRLPRAVRVPSPPAAPRGPLRQCAGGEAVLLVEDDALVREAVHAALSEAGFSVSTAVDGEQALRMLEHGARVDAVFSDIVMPGAVNGTDLAESVLTRFPQVRVVLTTGYTERRVPLPEVRMLIKPYQMADAVEALQEVLARPLSQPDTAAK
jgi:signal transduction histidine kinase/ActR/RegA family two-component response regulator